MEQQPLQTRRSSVTHARDLNRCEPGSLLVCAAPPQHDPSIHYRQLRAGACVAGLAASLRWTLTGLEATRASWEAVWTRRTMALAVRVSLYLLSSTCCVQMLLKSAPLFPAYSFRPESALSRCCPPPRRRFSSHVDAGDIGTPRSRFLCECMFGLGY